MDTLSKEYIIDFFNNRLMHFGDRPEALGWLQSGQVQHYKAMLDVGDITGSRILDFGCGKGDFYQFLVNKGIQVEYTGIDINENLIALASAKYPHTAFRTLDITTEEIGEDFDYIFCCGVFNLRFQGIERVIKDSMQILFRHCTKAFAYNGLSIYAKVKEFQLHYSPPEELFKFAVERLSPYVSLRQDRLEGEFTMFVYRDLNRTTPQCNRH